MQPQSLPSHATLRSASPRAASSSPRTPFSFSARGMDRADGEAYTPERGPSPAPPAVYATSAPVPAPLLHPPVQPNSAPAEAAGALLESCVPLEDPGANRVHLADQHDKHEEAHLLQELPAPPEEFHGTTRHQGKHYVLEVSNQRGYMAHVHCEARFPGVLPSDVFAVLANPNNSGVFRSIKDVGERRLLESTHDGKVRLLEVEQVGETKFLWVRKPFSTRLLVREDERDPLRPSMTFSLIRSDLLSAFNGSWHIEPLSLDLPDSPKAGAHQHQQHRQEESGTAAADGTHDGSAVVQAHAGVVRGARVVLNQDVSPKGVPLFMKHMPLMGGMLRGGIQRAVQGVVDDLSSVMEMVKGGQTVQQAIAVKKKKAGIKG